MLKQFTKNVSIHASPDVVWEYLTNVTNMKAWMAEPEMQIEIFTDWKIGHPIVIAGTHHGKFENKGIVLNYEENKILQYSHLSSVSKLSDKKENYSILTFTLTSVNNQTLLNLNIVNFPDETIFQHLDFYWTTTLKILKQNIEKNSRID
jgi:uncharacterized protein YndB with AHSA1/START domain